MNHFKKLISSFSALLLLLAPLSFITILTPQLASAGANQCTWTGGGADDNWSTDANWACSVGTGPTTGYDLIFPMSLATGSSGYLNNDLSAANEYSGIWLTDNPTCTGDINGYTILGNGFSLAGDIIFYDDNSCTQSLYLNVDDLFITSNSTFDVAGTLNIGGFASSAAPFGQRTATTLNLGTNSLSINGTITNSFTILGREITGSGGLTIDQSYTYNSVWIYEDNSTYSGNIVANEGHIAGWHPNSFGNTSGTTTVQDGATLQVLANTSGTYTYPENFILNGGGTGGSYKIGLSSQNDGCCDPSTTNTYGVDSDETTIFNLTGTITLGSNIEIYAGNPLTISGSLLGPTRLISHIGGASDIILSASSNTTATANGTLSPAVYYLTLSDSQPSTSVTIRKAAEITISGTRSDIYVYDGGILFGTGTINNLTSTGGILRPGLSPGVMNTGNLDFDSATVMDAELEGTGAGQYDQFNVTGTVSLGNATLNTILFNGYAPNISDSFTIINNDGSDAVVGTFGGLAQGAEITVGTYKFTISYTGGTGNDVVLTTTYVPGPPGTGLGVFQNSLAVPAVLVAAGALIVVISNKKVSKAKSRR